MEDNDNMRDDVTEEKYDNELKANGDENSTETVNLTNGSSNSSTKNPPKMNDQIESYDDDINVVDERDNIECTDELQVSRYNKIGIFLSDQSTYSLS